MRFFLTAPLFGILAAALLLWSGPQGFSNWWLPAPLAATHLLVLGFMSMVMLGALLQVFPVVIGHPIRQSRWVSRAVHMLLVVGALLLAAALLRVVEVWAFWAAAAALATAAFTFLLAAGLSLSGVRSWGDTTRAIALALLALAVTVGLGLWLAAGHVGIVSLAHHWTDFHAGWGLAGWLSLLLMGVAYRVVPMFQVTPNYPWQLSRFLAPWLFAMLVLATLLHAAGVHGWPLLAAKLLAAAGLVAFAVATLDLQRRRRRRLADTTVSYWRLGMICLLLAVALWLAAQFWSGLALNPRYGLALGALVIVGVAMSVINGMLYKIVPFLVWLHLSSKGPIPGGTPNMKQIIPDRRSKWQFYVHLAALLACGAFLLGVPYALPVAALIFAASNLMLWLDILSALLLYRRLHNSNGGQSTIAADKPS